MITGQASHSCGPSSKPHFDTWESLADNHHIIELCLVQVGFHVKSVSPPPRHDGNPASIDDKPTLIPDLSKMLHRADVYMLVVMMRYIPSCVVAMLSSINVWNRSPAPRGTDSL